MIRCHTYMRVRLSTRKATYWLGSASKTGASKVRANPNPTTYAAAWISAATPPIFCRSFIIYLLFSKDIDESRLKWTSIELWLPSLSLRHGLCSGRFKSTFFPLFDVYAFDQEPQRQ